MAALWDYMGACTARGAASERTKAAYGAAIGLFLGWCQGRGLDPVDARERDIEDWRAHLLAEGAAAGTVMLRLSAVRTLYRALARADRVASNPAEYVKSPKPEAAPVDQAMRKHIMPEVFMAVLGKIEDDARGRRDRAMLLTMFLLGLRVSEVAGLDWADWKGETVSFRAKGGQARELALPEVVQAAFKSLQEGTPEAAGAMFTGDGGRFTVRGVQKMVAARLRAGGLVPAGRGARSPHALRHSCGNNGAIAGCSPFAIQDQLGHSSQRTTGIYTRVAARYLGAPSMAIAKGMGI